MSSSVDALIRLLRQRQLMPAAEVRRTLDVSAPTLMRRLQEAGPLVLAVGETRRRAYAARRALRGSLAPLPLYGVDPTGRPHHVAQLHLAYPNGMLVEPVDRAWLAWPMEASGGRMRDGWFDGLPYFLQDMRPQGFLGRQFAQAHAALLQVSPDPQDWSDDDVLHALSVLGADQSGHFIVGEAALRRFQAGSVEPAVPADARDEAYPALALQAMAGGHAGSSAAGEFPKFTAHVVEQGGRTVPVLVKFSGSDDAAQTRRWADLLVCECIASEVVPLLPGLRGAASRIVQAGGRTFLEVDRFDRQGATGRHGLCSWAAINADWFGMAGRSWAAGAAAMGVQGLVDEATAQAVRRLEFFGQLIANTDMHDGNLSFQPEDGRLVLSPVYDMLPMAYRPLPGVELADVRFVVPLPLPQHEEPWHEAARAAVVFWERAAGDPRISPGFRSICAGNAERVMKAVGR